MWERLTSTARFEGLLPPDVVVVDASGDVPDARLLKEEARALGPRVVDARRREFTISRHCARRALVALGLSPTAILRSESRAPIWPLDVVGSITHCTDYCAAAVARRQRFQTIGIDAELHRPLPDGVLDMISLPEERDHLAALRPGDTCWDTLLFSAKESVYKAWYPVARTWLGFHDVVIRFAPHRSAFEARVIADGVGPAHAPRTFSGRFTAHGGVIATGIAAPADEG